MRRFNTIVLPSQYERAMQEAYIAYYGRPADTTGLHYWGARLDQENGNLDALIGAYGTSDEYTSRFGGLDDATLIDTLYTNLFGRSADLVGRQWYIEERLVPYRQQWSDDHGGDATGATEYALSRIALDILYGAQNEDRVIMDHKLEVAQYFTEEIVRWGVSYDESDIPVAVDILRLVTADPQSVGQAKQAVDAVIDTL
jgi:S-layer protein